MGLRDLLSLIATVRAWVDKLGIPLKELYELVVPLFELPDLVDSEATRNWVRSLLAVLKRGVTLTETELDDKAIGTLSAIVETDAAWDTFHALLTGMFHLDRVGDGPEPTAEESELAAKIMSAIEGGEPSAEDPKIGILTIISIAGFVLKVIQFIRERRQG